MAYVDFSGDPMLALAPAAPRHDPIHAEPAAPPVATGLSALEWSVVALARRDSLRSLAQPGRISIALGTVFGPRRPSPQLADTRLEALRRMAVLSWHRGYAVPPAELRAFEEAGFSREQYATLLGSISMARAEMGSLA